MPADAAPSLVLVDDLPEVGGRVALSPEESRYLVRVCRAHAGERVSATDGRGRLAVVTIVAAGRPVVVEVESVERAERTRTAWVMSGPPEGERGDWLVEKLAELGVARFQPLQCARGSWQRLRGRGERWRRLAVAALRQSRRRFLLEVREPRPLAEVLAELPPGTGSWLADPDGAPAAVTPSPGAGLAVGLVGPAAGLDAGEKAAILAAGFTPIALSGHRLRAETAALAWGCWWSAGERAPGAAGLDASGWRP